MGFRQLYITKAEKLSLANNNLVIRKDKESQEIAFPLEDLDLVFLEDPNAVVSTRLLSELKKVGVSIIFCGPDYLPSSMVVPINGHYLQSDLLNLQINLLPSKKTKLWDMIIRQKIANQMAVLENTVNDGASYLRLKEYREGVKFGDEKNMEGQAAREYFRALFGEDFIRFGGGPVSSALNYGYSILTGAVIRSVAFNGLNDNLGIWHSNAKNANNLSCDFVEPFRQIVDYFVYTHLGGLDNPLSLQIRGGMVNLLNSQILVAGKKYQVSYAISQFVSQFATYLRTGDISMVSFPEWIRPEPQDNG